MPVGLWVVCAVCVPLLIGCGVQAGDDGRADACAEIGQWDAVKDDTDALDRELNDLRPAEVTPESVKALAPRYRSASEQYGALLDRAKAELARARSDDSDFTGVWKLTVESLTIRRDGVAFFAAAFARPERFKDPAVQQESGEWRRKTDDINARVQESSSQWMRDHGFEETPDGQFNIDC